MEEIAVKAGVSQATVSRVINGHNGVSERKRKLVKKWARKLDYQPNRTAQSLKNNKSNLIGLIINDISNPYFAEIVHAVENEAAKNGYNIILCNTENDSQKEKEAINSLRSRQIDGLMIAPADKQASHLKSLKTMDMSVVVITQIEESFTSVAVDHEKGGRLIAQHLLDLGHRKIGYIGPGNKKGFRKDYKFEGFKKALFESGIEFDNKYFIQVDRNFPDIALKNIYDKVSENLKQNEAIASAYFAHNDLAAYEAIKAFEDNNYHVPEDLAIAGFDNDIYSQIIRPSLTTISQPIKTIGHVALELLLKKIDNINEDNENIMLEPKLILRDSTLKYTFNN
jgi:LacI family transcriptional regulator